MLVKCYLLEKYVIYNSANFHRNNENVHVNFEHLSVFVRIWWPKNKNNRRMHHSNTSTRVHEDFWSLETKTLFWWDYHEVCRTWFYTCWCTPHSDNSIQNKNRQNSDISNGIVSKRIWVIQWDKKKWPNENTNEYSLRVYLLKSQRNRTPNTIRRFSLYFCKTSRN